MGHDAPTLYWVQNYKCQFLCTIWYYKYNGTKGLIDVLVFFIFYKRFDLSSFLNKKQAEPMLWYSLHKFDYLETLDISIINWVTEWNFDRAGYV